MSVKVKNKIMVFLTAGCLLGLSVWNFFKPADAFSVSERRKLEQPPDIRLETVLSGEYMEQFESSAMDQFPVRDSFRRLKAVMTYGFFGQKDNNGIYLAKGHAAAMEYPLDADSVTNAAEHFRYLYETYMKDTDVKVYGVIVPDKNYYLAEESGHLAMDYDELYDRLYRETDFIRYIDIRDSLSLDNYYRTDPHWKQETLQALAAEIAEQMGVTLQESYEEETTGSPFYGAYWGQAALPVEPDEMKYLTNEELRSCSVYNYETGQETEVYDMEKAEGKDPYELFLSGSVSLLTITNPLAETERELIVFRDSFGSSIAPLFAEGYSKITLVDIRYIQSRSLERYITFDNQDVLFLYSTLVLNHSSTMK